MQIDISTLKLVLLFFWALWFTLVLLNNSFEGLKKAGILPEGWKFASENYAEIEKSLSTYTPPGWLAALLFTGVWFWQGLAVITLWYAFTSSVRAGTLQVEAVNTAFAVSTGLWLVFLLADEILKQYDTKIDHTLLLLAQLATLLVIHLLPG